MENRTVYLSKKPDEIPASGNHVTFLCNLQAAQGQGEKSYYIRCYTCDIKYAFVDEMPVDTNVPSFSCEKCGRTLKLES